MRKLIAVVLALGSLALLATALRQGLSTRQRQDAYPKRAIIVEKTENPYRLRVGYIDKRGLPHQAEVEVGKADWEQYSAGNLVDVFVPAAEPDRAWLQTEGEASYGTTVILAVLAFLCGCGAVAMLLIGRDREHTRAERPLLG